MTEENISEEEFESYRAEFNDMSIKELSRLIGSGCINGRVFKLAMEIYNDKKVLYEQAEREFKERWNLK